METIEITRKDKHGNPLPSVVLTVGAQVRKMTARGPVTFVAEAANAFRLVESPRPELIDRVFPSINSICRLISRSCSDGFPLPSAPRRRWAISA